MCWGNDSSCWGNVAILLGKRRKLYGKWSILLGKWHKICWGGAQNTDWNNPSHPCEEVMYGYVDILGDRGQWTKFKDMCFAGAWLAFLTSIGEMCAKSRCEAPVMPSGRRRLHPDYTFIQPEWQMYHWCPACCRCAFSPILGHITIVRPHGEEIQGVDLFLLQILKRISFDWYSKARQFNLGKL